MYDYIRIRLQGMAKTERGASAVEYGLLVALIAIAIIVGITALGSKLNIMFNEHLHQTALSQLLILNSRRPRVTYPGPLVHVASKFVTSADLRDCLVTVPHSDYVALTGSRKIRIFRISPLADLHTRTAGHQPSPTRRTLGRTPCTTTSRSGFRAWPRPSEAPRLSSTACWSH